MPGVENPLCGIPLEHVLDDQGQFKISLNPLTPVGTFIGLLTTLGSILWYDYTILNNSDNVIVALYVWGVRAVLFALGIQMLNRAFPQVGNILARFLGR